MSRYGFAVSMIIIFLIGCTPENPFSQLKRSAVAPDKAAGYLPLRTSFDAQKGTFLSEAQPCIKGEYVFIPQRSLSLDSKSDYSLDDIINEISVTGTLSFNYFPILEVSGELTNRTRVTSNRSRFTIFHDIDYNAGTLVLRNPVIDEDYVKTLSPAQRRTICGHGVISRIQLGARATIGMEFLLGGDTLSNYVRAIVAGRLVLGPFKSPKVSITLADGYLAKINKVDVLARVFVDQQGGDARFFSLAERLATGSCHISITADDARTFQKNPDFLACIRRLARVVDYFRSCFQNNINPDKNSIVSGNCNNLVPPSDGQPSEPENNPSIAGVEFLTGDQSDRSHLIPISYGVSSYQEIGLLGLAQDLVVSPDDARLKHLKTQFLRMFLAMQNVKNTVNQVVNLPFDQEFIFDNKRPNPSADELRRTLQNAQDFQDLIFKKDACKGKTTAECSRPAMDVCNEQGVTACENALRDVQSNLQKLLDQNGFLKESYSDQ